MNRTDHCPACQGGGLVPAPGCTCDGNAHTCMPAVCTTCMGSGVPVACPIGEAAGASHGH
jgi:hypothetical protein